jgi:hypothetical protein
VQGEPEDSRSLLDLREEIRLSPRVKALVGDKQKGTSCRNYPTYLKWKGSHWVLASLADIGYPKGCGDFSPVVDQVLGCWLNPDVFIDKICDCVLPSKDRGVPVINGRARRCASQQGNALFSAVRLGFIDERSHQLARLLIHWQWPDDGWNCDCNPQAAKSSFWESLIPLRALSAYADETGDVDAKSAAVRVAELFLKHNLFRRLSNGEVMNPTFVKLHYPCYWRYDILFGLKVMAEAGFVGDPRCNEALDILESKRLPDGGWPAEERYYSSPNKDVSGSDHVSWGGICKTRMNEWVTADALYVLKAAGRV